MSEVDVDRLAQALLRLPIGTLDWLAGEIVKGEDDAAVTLADAIWLEYDALDLVPAVPDDDALIRGY